MKRALIIGASGGIGAAVCSQLSERQCTVVGLSRNKDDLDITDRASVDRVLGNLEGTFDFILIATGILAPAGGAPEKSLEQVDATAMQTVIAANVIGPALVLRHVTRLLPKDGRAVVATLTARVGSITDNHLGGWYSYRASKAAANQVVRTAAIEIGRRRKDAIVVALHPGTVATRFTEAFKGHDKVTPESAATNLLAVADGLTRDDTGKFFDWKAEEVPW
ncbi:MAG: SDR family NAD(P)-dependent oxidoreductase [Roseibium sp.]|nr:SDR family NAD(P)-dependent oxidoreductase [Roseibium sp.]